MSTDGLSASRIYELLTWIFSSDFIVDFISTPSPSTTTIFIILNTISTSIFYGEVERKLFITTYKSWL